jgi:hypothetical protein
MSLPMTGMIEVGHQRLDDLAERRADDHADGEVDHVALDREFAEFRAMLMGASVGKPQSRGGRRASIAFRSGL